jgi:hypothetical protein
MTGHTAGREPELLTITEAAELLRAPVATLRYWRHSAPARAASASAAASSTVPTTCAPGSTPSTARTAPVSLDGLCCV